MRLVRLAFLVVVAASSATAQHVLRLDRPPSKLDSLAIAVDDVHDLRAEQDSVGEVRTWGMLNILKPAQLGEDGAEAELRTYLQRALPIREGARRVSVGIDLIQVSEQIVFDTEFGRAEVAFRFFEPRGDSLGLLGSSAGFQELSRKGDVTRLHGGNLGKAIVSALQAAAKAGVFEAEPLSWATPDELRAQSSVLDARSVEKLLVAEGDTASIRGEVKATAAIEGTETARRVVATAQAARSMRQYVTVGPVLGGTGRGASLTAGVRDTAPAD